MAAMEYHLGTSTVTQRLGRSDGHLKSDGVKVSDLRRLTQNDLSSEKHDDKKHARQRQSNDHERRLLSDIMATHRYGHDTTQEICVDIHDERARQQQLLDEGRMSWDMAQPGIHKGLKLGVLMEEVGEVAKEVIENGPNDKLYAELVQVAAVAVAWAESIPFEERGV